MAQAYPRASCPPAAGVVRCFACSAGGPIFWQDANNLIRIHDVIISLWLAVMNHDGACQLAAMQLLQ